MSEPVKGDAPATPARLADARRLTALRDSGLLDTTTEETFDRVTRLTAGLLGVPVAQVNVVGHDRQISKSQVGVAEPWASLPSLPLSHSFCQHVVTADAPLVVEDARKHELVWDNLAIEDLDVAAYLGVPLRDEAGHVLGALCAIDHETRTWSPDDVSHLEDLASFLRTELQLRDAARQLDTEARSERRRREMSNRRLRQLADASADAIFIVSTKPEFSLDYISPAVEDITGYPPEAFHADPELGARLLHPDDIGDFEQAMADQPQREPVECRCQHRDGSWRWISLLTAALTDEDDEIVAVQAVVRDIDRRKRAELSLRNALATEQEALDHLSRLNEMKSTFLTAISHEVRTPLTTILGFSAILDERGDELPDARKKELAGRLNANAQRLQHLLTNLLDVDRLSRGVVVRAPSATRLDDLVRRVVDGLANEGRRVEVDLSAVTAVVDAAQIERVVENLLSNALRHTAPGTRVRIGLSDGPGTATLVIEDEGPGIADELKEQLFAPFAQGSDAATAASPGTGVGLTLAREFVTLHDGEVRLEDRPGGGTRAVVRLPATARSAVGN